MNHDYAHCLDWDRKKCPKECFRAQLTKDLTAHKELYSYKGWTYAHFRHTSICPLNEKKEG